MNTTQPLNQKRLVRKYTRKIARLQHQIEQQMLTIKYSQDKNLSDYDRFVMAQYLGKFEGQQEVYKELLAELEG